MNRSNSTPDPIKRHRVLFIAEAVTLAHATRPIVLANTLDPMEYDIHLAWDPRYSALFPDLPPSVHYICSISTASFLQALAKGHPVYTAETLRKYVNDDMSLLRSLTPDIVVGDFRLSLAISARLTGIPYLTITNSYWSPCAQQRYPIPEHPLTKIVGVKTTQKLFDMMRPLVFAYHTLPLNRIRRENGLAGLGLDLRRVYSHADCALFADVPELGPPLSTCDIPHYYLGPILWSPQVSRPTWWSELPDKVPVIYVSLGSSGRSDLLPRVLDALATLPYSIVIATAGKTWPQNVPDNAFVTEYLPAVGATPRCRLAICNGGNPTTTQALAAGVPVVGISNNLDQYLNMAGVERAGVGIMLRSDQASAYSIREAVDRVLGDPGYKQRAHVVQETIKTYDTPVRFRTILANYLSGTT